MNATTQASKLTLVAAIAVFALGGCAHHAYLRPVATVRQQAAEALSCDDEMDVRRISTSYETVHATDAYVATGCGGTYRAFCDGPGQRRGECHATPALPMQGVPASEPRAIVRVSGSRAGQAPIGAVRMWERVYVGSEYSQRDVPVLWVPPLTFAVRPGPQRIVLRTGPGRTRQETRLFSNRYFHWRTQVDVRENGDGCSAGFAFDALPGAIYSVKYETLEGQCTMSCSLVTDEGEADCPGFGSL